MATATAPRPALSPRKSPGRPPPPPPLPPGVTPTRAGAYRAVVRLTRFDAVGLGDHATPEAARRARVRFLAASLTGATPQAVVESLRAAGVVPADALPPGVVRFENRNGTRYRGRARFRGAGLATGVFACPWRARAALVRLVRRVACPPPPKPDRPRSSRYPGVRRVKGGAWQARWCTPDGRHVNLGLWTRDAPGAEACAGRAAERFRDLVRAGAPVGAAFGALQATGVIPATTRAPGATTCGG